MNLQYIFNLQTLSSTLKTRGVYPHGFLYPRDPSVPIPVHSSTHTRERGCGFHAGAGTGKGRVTHGLPVTCTSHKIHLDITTIYVVHHFNIFCCKYLQ
jgi:hypothetical protein